MSEELRKIKWNFNKSEILNLDKNDEVKWNFLDTIVQCDMVLIRKISGKKNNLIMDERAVYVSFDTNCYDEDCLIIDNNFDGIYLKILLEKIDKIFVTFNPNNTKELWFVIDAHYIETR